MPLVGGGGAGNVAGGNPAGTGSSINYIGNHAFAYSGSIASSATETNYLDFTIGPQYIVATIQPVYFAEGTNNIVFNIRLDGELVQSVEVTSARDYTPFEAINLIIPPYAHVEISVDNRSGGTEDCGVALTGRVYA